MPSRKKSEAWGSPGPEDEPKPAATAPAASSSNAGGAARWQLDAAAAAGTMQQALLLAAKCEVPAWEVHLAFAESLLVHNQRLWEQQQPGVTMQQLLEASLAVLHPGPQQAGVTPEWLLDASLEVLLAGAQPAAALLGVLLRSVWRASSSSCPRHLALCLQLAHRSAAALAAAAADGGGGQRWQQAAAVLAACHAAVEQLLQAAPGLDAKLFLHPVVQQLAASLPGCSADSEGSSQQPRGQHSQPVSSQALNWQLLAYASGSNAAHLASAVEMLARQCNGLAAAAQSAPAAEADGGSSGGCGAGYPSSGSTVFMALFCRSTSQQCAARGGLDAAAVQQSLECLRRMSPAHAAAAAAFAAAGGPCPLPLPPGREQPVAVALLEQQQAQVLAAALQVLDGSSMAEPAGTAGVDPHLQQQIEQLRQQHALLAAKGCIAAACPDASRAQLAAAREAAEAVQRAALVAAAAPGSEGGSRGEEGPSSALDSCLQQLLTTGTPAPAVLRVAAVLEALQQQPSQAPPEADALLAQPVAAAAAQQAASAAAAAEVAAALGAMSGLPSSGTPQEQQLSPGDAVQNLFALLRSLHSAAASEADEGGSGSPAAAAAAVAQAVAAMRLLVWQQLQRKAASYDGSGGAAASEAHVQVLELLGSVGSSGMWPGWAPHDLPAVEAGPGGDEGGGAGGGFSHRQVLLFTRTAAALALEWQAAMQECRLSAADFGSAESAEAALLRLAAAAEEAQQLRLLLRLLAEVLDGAFPAAAAARSEAAAAAEGAGESGSSSPAASPGAAASAGAAVVPLHRVWSTCLRMLLPLGDLAGVLAALDDHSAQQAQRQQRQQGQQEQEQGGGLQAAGMPRALVSEAEAAALLEAADAAQGVAAAAALALLLPYTRLQLERWQLLVQACASAGSTAADLAAALPALAPLLLLLVQRQPGLLVDLVGGRQQQQFKLLVGAALLQQQREPSYGVSLGGSSLTLRMAVAAAAAAVLTAARQHTAAAWLAMQACSTPRLLQVLDSGSRVLQQLLCSCSAGGAAAAGALAAARRLAAAGGDAQLAVPQAAAALLQALPEQCAEALCQLTSDLQLAH